MQHNSTMTLDRMKRTNREQLGRSFQDSSTGAEKVPDAAYNFVQEQLQDVLVQLEHLDTGLQGCFLTTELLVEKFNQ